PWEEIKRFGADIVFEPLVLAGDGRSLVVRTNEHRNQVDLVRMQLPSGNLGETVFSAPGFDVERAIVGSFDRRVIGAMVYRDGRLHTEYLDRPNEELRAALQARLGDKNVAIFDTSEDGRRSLLLASDETDPGTLYLYDASAHAAHELLSQLDPMPHVRLVRS